MYKHFKVMSFYYTHVPLFEQDKHKRYKQSCKTQRVYITGIKLQIMDDRICRIETVVCFCLHIFFVHYSSHQSAIVLTKEKSL